MKDNSGCRGNIIINQCGPKSIWSEHLKELSRAAVVLGGGGGGGDCSPRVKDGHRWVFRDLCVSYNLYMYV